jgi:hypothetical protein
MTTPMPVKGGPWLQTHRGLAWMADAPEVYPYDVEEIAHALSNLCRFAGHTREFYSVAQHSVVVARAIYDNYEGRPDAALLRAALLHDAAEAFCIDLPAPIKHMPEMAGYRALIKRTEAAIGTHFGLSLFLDHFLIKHADLVVLATEKRDLLSWSAFDSHWAGLPDPRRARIDPWDPETACAMFLDAWNEFDGVAQSEGDASRSDNEGKGNAE